MTSSARGFLGAGDLYMARYIGGVLAGLAGPFECSKFEIKPNADTKELTSKGRTSYGQVVESVTLPQPADLTVELTEVNKESMAIAMFGTTAAITQAAGTWSAAIDVATKHNEWVALPKAAILTLVAKDSTNATTYVLGTDYLLNQDLGLIKTLSTGQIDATETLKVTGTYDDITGTQIQGMTNNNVRAKFVLHGKNFVDDSPVIVTVFEAVISADSAFDFLADDFNTVSLPGRMKTPAGMNQPFTIDLRDIQA